VLTSLIIAFIEKLLKNSKPCIGQPRSTNKIYPENKKEETELVNKNSIPETAEKPGPISQFKAGRKSQSQTQSTQELPEKQNPKSDKLSSDSNQKGSKLKLALGWITIVLISGVSIAYTLMIIKSQGPKKDFMPAGSYALAFLFDNLGFLPALGFIQFVLLK
jgi:hypothetical protein